jgi:hypothetical protein
MKGTKHYRTKQGKLISLWKIDDGKNKGKYLIGIQGTSEWYSVAKEEIQNTLTRLYNY